jgi:hypothetical protein
MTSSYGMLKRDGERNSFSIQAHISIPSDIRTQCEKEKKS